MSLGRLFLSLLLVLLLPFSVFAGSSGFKIPSFNGVYNGTRVLTEKDYTKIIEVINNTNTTDVDNKCIFIENPTALDDFNSIWIANGFNATITKIWGESDQTVVFNLMVDDGTPIEVSSTDLTAAGGEVEDESLDGDTTMGDGDKLNLKLTSVSGDPTWCSICWTYTKKQ